MAPSFRLTNASRAAARSPRRRPRQATALTSLTGPELPALTLRAGRFAGSIESRSSWVAASITLAILSISSGAPLVVVVGLKPIAASLGDDRSVVALAASLIWFGTGLGGIMMGRIADRGGMRPIAILGGSLSAVGWAASSIGHTLGV